MINKWETYMPIALHRTYDRLYRQPHTLTAATLETLDFESFFTKVCAHAHTRACARACTCACGQHAYASCTCSCVSALASG